MKHHMLTLLACACLVACAEDLVAHRQAFRARLAQDASTAIAEGLRDSDAVIRRYCVYQDFLRNGPEAVEGSCHFATCQPEIVVRDILHQD